MSKKVEVKIIIPFIDTQKKGDLREMKESDAIKYEKEGLVKILNKAKPTKTVKVIKKEQKDIYEVIFNRHRKLANPCYINVFSGDDQKKQPKIYSYTYNLHEKTNDFIKNELEHYNTGSYASFMNFNLLEKNVRNDANISKILYVFIDLDDATQEHNELIKSYLIKKNITYDYNAQTGHGYHFLVPVDFSPTEKIKVKGFLNYLKANVCDKVDIATHTNERLIRAPETMHNKDKESKKLITLHSVQSTQEEIENNNSLILQLQEEQKKGTKDLVYQNSLVKKDIFFSEVLSNKHEWVSYYKFLDKAKDRNDPFIKNMGFFLCHNPEFEKECENFLKGWENSRFSALLGWVKKCQEKKLAPQYYELLKWSKINKIDAFIEILLRQTKKSFLDDYEVYYLEDEKKESSFLLYYPEKDYYVQKSQQEIFLTIYYDCCDKGINLEQELNLSDFEGYEKATFKGKMTMILSNIHRLLEQEKRIKKVFNIGYEPTEKKFIPFENKFFFNTYTKTELWDYYKEENKKHFPNIKELLLNLCNKNEEYYLYLCKWLAWQIKNPDIKLPTAIILQGRQGSGKGTFKDLILDSIFGRNCQEINQTHLECSFNDYLLGKQIIVANEVMHNENRQTLPNILKNLVTDKTITISRKFQKSITGQNYTHWIFCTNSDNPIKIDADDRRYSVFYSEKLRKGLATEIRKNLEYELKAFICFLKDLEVNFEEVSEPIMTEAKEEIIEINKDSVQKFQEFMQQFNDLNEAFMSIYGHNQDYHINDSFGDGEKYILTEKIYLLYEKWCEKYKERGIYAKQNFSKKLSNKNIKSKAKWNDGRTFKMYSLSDLNRLMEA